MLIWPRSNFKSPTIVTNYSILDVGRGPESASFYTYTNSDCIKKATAYFLNIKFTRTHNSNYTNAKILT